MPARPVLPTELRRPLLLVAMIAALVVIALGVTYAAGGRLGPWDGRAMPLYGFEPPWRTFALVVDFLGEPVGVVLVVGALVGVALLLRRPRAAVLVVAGVGLGGAITTLLKPVVGRPIHVDYLAYPSGHTATLTVVGFVTGLLLADRTGAGRRLGLVFVLGLATVGAAAMSYSQTMLSAHYLTDTVGGYCVALTIVPLLALAIDRLAGRLRPAGAGQALLSRK
ncbi:phosphatase PAP2 family protein [Actinophytocola sp.]|uniref:phosphatase PAP2 family protein n=1 Tax=Actinophytocola sp. TaxID=1872138 RepID=UPI002D809FEB|nr:phosphatase PAP2 family protein [Actinophytocola sp.]HET9138550.1 phosphatase PAP2 family protein [Actinophytocola sp.]